MKLLVNVYSMLPYGAHISYYANLLIIFTYLLYSYILKIIISVTLSILHSSLRKVSRKPKILKRMWLFLLLFYTSLFFFLFFFFFSFFSFFLFLDICQCIFYDFFKTSHWSVKWSPSTLSYCTQSQHRRDCLFFKCVCNCYICRHREDGLSYRGGNR